MAKNHYNYYRNPHQSRKYYRGRNQVISNNVFVALLGLILIGYGLWQWSGAVIDRVIMVIIVSTVVIAGVGIFFVVYHRFRLHKRMLAFSQSEVERMDGIVFERYLAELLKEEGYTSVQVTPPQGDYGADLFAEKDGVSFAIQAKRYSEHNLVGVSAVQQVSSAKEFYDKEQAMVITTGFFSDAAKIMGKKNKVILLDKYDLSAIINRHKPKK